MAEREGGDQRVAVIPATAFGGTVALSRNLVEREVADTSESVVAVWIQTSVAVSEVSEVDVVAFPLSLHLLAVLAHGDEATLQDDFDSEMTLVVVFGFGGLTHFFPEAVVVEQR